MALPAMVPPEPPVLLSPPLLLSGLPPPFPEKKGVLAPPTFVPGLPETDVDGPSGVVLGPGVCSGIVGSEFVVGGLVGCPESGSESLAGVDGGFAGVVVE